MRQTKKSADRRAFLQLLCAAPAVALETTAAQAQPAAPLGHRFYEVVGHRIAEHVKASRLAILPLGSVEYHGPSGPTFTDSLLAVGLADRLGPRLKASVFPVVSFTHCPAHTAGFQGSISVRPETVTMYLEDILRGIHGTGFRRIFVLNGHNANSGPAQGAISQVTTEFPDCQVLIANWWETLTPALLENLKIFTSGNGGRGHGGPLEMSATAAFAPSQVESGAAPDLPAIERMADFPHYLEKREGRGWPGYSGKLSEISRERGERLVKIAEDKLAALVEKWLQDQSRPGSW